MAAARARVALRMYRQKYKNIAKLHFVAKNSTLMVELFHPNLMALQGYQTIVLITFRCPEKTCILQVKLHSVIFRL